MFSGSSSSSSTKKIKKDDKIELEKLLFPNPIALTIFGYLGFGTANLPSQSNINQFHAELTNRFLGLLLEFIAYGNQDEAEKILQTNPALLLEKGNVTDPSGRLFEGITAFQYPLWAGDRHMWQMILKYLPKNQALRQLQEHETITTGYVAEHGRYFDFTKLILVLNAYVDRRFDSEYWCKQVGGAQRELPAYVLHEYCRPDRSFQCYDLPNYSIAFNEATLPRTHKIINEDKSLSLLPLSTTKGLGIDFAIYRNSRHQCFGSSQYGVVSDSDDNRAIKCLSEAVARHRLELRQTLEKKSEKKPVEKSTKKSAEMSAKKKCLIM